MGEPSLHPKQASGHKNTSSNQALHSKLWNHKAKSSLPNSVPSLFQLTLLSMATPEGLVGSVIYTTRTPCKGEGNRIRGLSICFLSTGLFVLFLVSSPGDF